LNVRPLDHCGGNRRLAGVPTFVRRAELGAAVEPDYLVGWVHEARADRRRDGLDSPHPRSEAGEGISGAPS
jgi:hypothetical protein